MILLLQKDDNAHVQREKRLSSCVRVYGTFQSIPHGHKDTPVLEQVFEPFVDMFTLRHSQKGFCDAVVLF